MTTTLQQLLEQTREIWFIGQVGPIRALFSLVQGPDEDLFTFFKRKNEAAMATTTAVDGYLLMADPPNEPLYSMLIRNQMGITTIQDYFNRAMPALPVPSFPSNELTADNSQIILDAFTKTYPPQPEFGPEKCPFTMGGKWPFDRNPLQFEPASMARDGFDDTTPVGGVWPKNGPDPHFGYQFRKITQQERAGKIALWERIAM